MAGFRSALVGRVRRLLVRVWDLLRTRRAQRISLALGVLLILYGLAGFFAVPPILRHILATQASGALHRQVTVGGIEFDPYRLRLEIDKLRVSKRDGSAPFVEIAHIHVKASWISVFDLAAVVSSLTIDRPVIHVVRTAPQAFNFSDLIAAQPAPPGAPPPPPSKPFRFAISNIRVRNGDIHFDDRVMGDHHNISHIQIGVPFIASLPADVDVYVQPLLAMTVDGSPLRIAGQTKPLSASLETIVNLNIHALNLHRYLGYVPVKLPIAIPRGTFSCRLQVHFVVKRPMPAIAISGRIALNQVQVDGASGAPLAGIGHLLVTLNDIEPLAGIFHVGQVRLEGLTPDLVIGPDGSTNLSAVIGGGAPAQAGESAADSGGHAQTQSSSAQPVAAGPPARTAAANHAKTRIDVTLDQLQISHSTIRVTDNSSGAPATLQLENLDVMLKNFTLNGGWASPFRVSAELASGGKISLGGTLDMTSGKAAANAAIDQLSLPALQPFARGALAARIDEGKLDAAADIKASFAPAALDVEAAPASVAIDNFALAAPGGRATPIKWSKFSIKVARADLAARDAQVSEVRLSGLGLDLRRARDGRLNLLTMLAPPAPRAQAAAAKPAKKATRSAKPARHEPAAEAAKAAPWKFNVASVVLDKGAVQLSDDAAPRPVKLEVSPLDISLKNVSSDFKKPIGVDVNGTIGRRGAFNIAGTAAISPLSAELKVTTRRIDLSPADAYISKDVNARIGSARLTMNGTASVSETKAGVRAGYRGDIALDNLRILDRLTGQDFMRWKSLSLTRVNAAGGGGEPVAHVGQVALTNFEAGIILTSAGKLNLQDITSTPGAPPGAPPPEPKAPAVQAAGAAEKSAAPEKTAAPAPIPADIRIGGITLHGGNVNYSDYFIKPNYAANLSDIAGKVGAFGTASSEPAPVQLSGEINGSAPLDITGSINPLAPMASVDLTVKADGVELTGFSPYTTKYTGYPIENGTLSLDVHYVLNNGNLTAENHIVIDQLTFGEHVENTTAINIPIRLAVTILKNSQGVIDLNVPISGSLSDPQFSLSGIILHAFWNVIVKAATSPLSIIASAFGTSANLSEINFAPGYAVLTRQSRAKLDTVAKALTERKGLTLQIQGCVDPALDRPALPEAKVDLGVREQMLKESGATGDPWDVKVAPDEYNKYLRRAYFAANFPKPRNFLGMQKSIPPDQMKKLMIEHTTVTNADLRTLADARAREVRKYLAGKVDAARLFVKPPNLDAKAPEGGGKATRAELSLQ